MSICCFRNGSFCESFEEATAGPVPAAIFRLSADGKAERLQERPQLEMEEGLLLVAGEFYVDPLEMEVEFLKAADARQWLEAAAPAPCGKGALGGGGSLRAGPNREVEA